MFKNKVRRALSWLTLSEKIDKRFRNLASETLDRLERGEHKTEIIFAEAIENLIAELDKK